ncbi:hypothetical protein DFH09DRAFT_1309203 [Mycena vulgaris]|nr:hypothetical protein DFH09DRAFT_1309203 [Mycena vulgaris]
MVSGSLPQELIDAIIDQVPDNTSLKPCALADLSLAARSSGILKKESAADLEICLGLLHRIPPPRIACLGRRSPRIDIRVAAPPLDSPRFSSRDSHHLRFLLHPRTLPYTSHIERLEIRIDSSSGRYDHKLLAACAATLKCLVIDPGVLVASINTPHLPHVRRVEIRVFVGHNRQFPSLFPTMLSMLASALPLVEVIALRFVVEPLHPEIIHCKLVRPNTLHSMDALFGRFVGAMDSHIPRLQDTGILTCTLAEPQLRYVERLP